jgi:hypothetical protein
VGACVEDSLKRDGSPLVATARLGHRASERNGQVEPMPKFLHRRSFTLPQLSTQPTSTGITLSTNHRARITGREWGESNLLQLLFLPERMFETA